MNTNTQRYEVIAPMPHFTHLFKGDILVPKQHALVGDCWGREDEDNVSRWVTFCPDYPHLFRLLKWWEHVSKNELPEYVKGKLLSSKPVGVFKVIWKMEGGNLLLREFDHNIFSWLVDCNLHPSTEAEYNDYLTKTKR
jgi:hypothetical protein